MTDAKALEQRITAYLACLSPQMQRRLLDMLERQDPLADASSPVVLGAARALIRGAEPAAMAPAERRGGAMRAFFLPFEAFVIDEELPEKWPTRIARSSLPPIWTFLIRDVAPGRLVHAADGEAGMPDALRAAVLAEAARLIAEVEGTARARQRLVGQIGGERAFRDLRDLIALECRRGPLDGLLLDFPRAVVPGDGAAERAAVEALRHFIERFPADATWAAAAILPRLEGRTILPRLAVGVGGPSVEEVRRSPAAALLDMALHELDRASVRYAALRSRDPAGAAAALRDGHETLRALYAVFDLDADEGWRRRAGAIRARMSDLLVQDLERVPALVRGALRPERSGSAEETIGALAILAAARGARDVLAVNEVLTRVLPVVEQTVEVMSERLLQALPRTPGAAGAALAGTIDTLVEVGGLVFGDDYARLLRRRASSPPTRAAG